MHPHPVKISLPQARAIALRAQGMDRQAAFGMGQEATLNAIEHLGYVQIDTISVVQRAHHHVLWSRVPDYAKEHLDELHAQRSVFEYWSHAASYLPMRDYAWSMPRMKSFQAKFHWSDDSPELRKAMRHVVSRIRKEGPLRARDFEAEAQPRKPGSWSFSKMEKRALHELWMRGDLMVSSRAGFQKSYDLRERVLPKEMKAATPTAVEFADWHVEQMLRAHGVVREAEFRYLKTGADAAIIRKRLADAIKLNKIFPVKVGEETHPAYVLSETLDQLPEPATASSASILSPFDNLVIQRERLRWLFGFDYQIECYVPAAKRKFGHFVLPVLWGDRFAARLEVKRIQKESRMVLAGLWCEPGFEKVKSFRSALRQNLEQFARFNDCGVLESGLLKR